MFVIQIFYGIASAIKGKYQGDINKHDIETSAKWNQFFAAISQKVNLKMLKTVFVVAIPLLVILAIIRKYGK